jgi:hypothetical protein
MYVGEYLRKRIIYIVLFYKNVEILNLENSLKVRLCHKQ